MAKDWKVYLISFGIVFVLGLISGAGVNSSAGFAVVVILIIMLFKTGEVSRFFRHLKEQDRKRGEDRRAWERRQSELKKLREDEREKEIGRSEAEGERIRREQERIRREGQRRQQEQKRNDILRNPLGGNVLGRR